ncbi:MAG: hypothetical protein EOM19_07865 [Candidatus Moranbacteria bacterium]|nr:hypothetical protein [Candidatus Moranbacteria bacterium]
MVNFLSIFVPMKSILHRLFSEKNIHFDEEEKNIMEDLFLAIGQLIETSQSTHRHVVNIREASSVIMTHALNRSMRTLTILTIVLSIPMILGSLYGMNVNLPFDDASWIFLAIIETSFIAMGAVFLFFFFVDKCIRSDTYYTLWFHRAYAFYQCESRNYIPKQNRFDLIPHHR